MALLEIYPSLHTTFLLDLTGARRIVQETAAHLNIEARSGWTIVPVVKEGSLHAFHHEQDVIGVASKASLEVAREKSNKAPLRA